METAPAVQVQQESDSPKSYLDELPYYTNYHLADNEVPLARYLLPADSTEVQRGVESGRFPTLAGLARLQRQRGQPPNSSADAANESPPEPFPPRRTKAELLESRDFTEMDKLAGSVTPLPSDSWEQLALRVFKQCRSNLDKVRAAFIFACTHRQLEEVEGESPAYRAVRGKENIDVFEKLLCCEKVPNKKLYGYKKGMNYDSGLKAEIGGCWFACYVEGEWRFVDPRWGATSVVNYDSGRYGAIDDKGRVGSARERSGQSVFHCEEFWFLTDPDRLITSHCPQQNDLEWQLLVRQVSIEEFELMPCYFEGSAAEIEFYNLEPINCPWNVIVAKPGPVEVLLKELAGQQYMYEGKLKIHKKHISDDSKTAILSAYQQKACVSKAIRVFEDTVKFIFEPPYPGQYALQIMLWRQVTDINLKGCTFAAYTIHCPQSWESADVIPGGREGLDEFGPGRNLRRAGLTSEAPGELKAADGEASLEVAPLQEGENTGSGRQRDLTCQALGPDNKPLPGGSVLVWRDDQRNAFLFLAPDSGYYALVLYEKGRPVGQFLVDASSEAKDGASFPLPDWNRVGGLGFAHSADRGGGCRLVPLSHKTPYVRTEEAELALQFGLEGGESGASIQLKAELLTVGADGGTESVSDYSLVSGVEGGGYDVCCRFPRAGHYLLRLSSRESGSEWQLYYTYFVRAVGQVDGSAAAFPSLGPDWPAGGALIEPLDRTLPLGQPTPIRLRLPDSIVTGVEVVDERSGRREPLDRDPADPRLWIGSVSAAGSDGADATTGGVEGGGGGLTVVARINEGAETELVKFGFESDSTAQAKAAALREVQALNEQRQVAEENRKRKQENRRRREEGLEPLPVKKSAEQAAEEEAAAKAVAEAAAEAEKVAALAESSKKSAANAEIAAKKSAKSKVASNEASKAAAKAESAAQAVKMALVAAEAAAKLADEAKAASAAAAKSGSIEKALESAKLADGAAGDAKSAAQAASEAASDAQTASKAAANAEKQANVAAEAARKAAETAAVEAETSGNVEAKAASKEAAAVAEEAQGKAKAATEQARQAAADSEAAAKSSIEASTVAAAAAESAAAAKAAAKALAAAEAEAAAAAKDEVKLLIAQLDEALLSRKVVQLRNAIKSLESHEFELRGIHASKLRDARLTLTALQNRKDLRDAMKDAQRSRNTQSLRALVQRLEAEAEQQPPTEAQLALFGEDLRLAREAIQRDDRLRRIPSHKLEMNPKSLSELQRYSRPVDTVHRTVQALLLLLGNYEKRTRKWPRCQPLLKTITKSVADFQPSLVDPRIAARSREILDGIEKREIALQSAAAFAFYEWAVKTTESIKEAATPETFVPATVALQRRILGVTEEEDAKWDFEDKGIRRRSSVMPK